MKDGRILVLGAGGLVGQATCRKLKMSGYQNLLTPNRDELNLFEQAQVRNYFDRHRPDFVYMCAARVGGIHANNTYRAQFIQDNILIQAHVFEAAIRVKTPRLFFLGSSCIYPANCPQPMREEYLLSSALEKTNEPYAIAKIAGLKTAENIRRQYGLDYVSLMPTNLYGPNDNYHLENSHVLPALIRRMVEAKRRGDKCFTIWGTGSPRREFLYVDDLAQIMVGLMEKGERERLPDLINIGTGIDITVRDLAKLIARILKVELDFVFDTSRPDGTKQKLLDISRMLQLGVRPKYGLEEGIRLTIDDYLKRQEKYAQAKSVGL